VGIEEFPQFREFLWKLRELRKLKELRELKELSNAMSLAPRGRALAAVTFLLYFFANQTQVGWLYVMTALAAGLLLAAAMIPRRMLRGLALTRRLDGLANSAELELYAGDALRVDLEFQNVSRFPALQVRGDETCPPAPVEDRAQPFFVLDVPPRGSLTLSYETVCARRGWFEFPSVLLLTRAPFGLFSASRDLPVPTGLLVFPEYRELDHLALFDRMPAPQNTFARLGIGGEFVGVREYRPGDSRRHVHWRSTARAGQLIVKEFAEETQPGLTLALDLRASSGAGAGEDNSLELAIKIAATLARYAERRGLPVSLAANSRQWPAPPGPLTWWGLMNYLARAQAGGEDSLADCLRAARSTTFVAALLTAPDEAALEPLIELRRFGLGVLAVVIDPARFLPGASGKAESLAAALAANGVEARVIGTEPDWEKTLQA